MKPFCKCGCDKQVNKPGNRFINGHNRRGIYHTEKSKRKISKANKGNIAWNKGIPISKEQRKKMSISLRKKASEPSYVNGFCGKHHTKKCKEYLSKIQKGRPSYVLGYKHTKAAKKKIKEAGLEHWQNPEYRKKQIKAMFAGRSMKPTRPERRLRNRLNHLFLNEYKYVGDGSVLIGYKNPDFININGQKKIIELFGDYWHGKKYRSIAFNDNSSNKKHECQRIKHFAKYGYRTLVIWEHELKNISKLKRKLMRFHNE